MNKIIYITLPLLLAFAACNPMEDIYKEVDAEIAKKNANEQYFSTRTLLEDNYTLIEDDYKLSTNENLRKYKSFSSRITAKDNLTQILNDKMVFGEIGKEYKVTYKFYQGSLSYAKNYIKDLDKTKLPNDVKVYELADSDYDAMGAPGKYNNFSDSSKPKDYLPTLLKVKFPYAKEGTKYLVVYKFYGKKKKDDKRKSAFKEAKEYTFTEGVWKSYSSVVNKTATMSYKVDKKTWEFVPPIAFVFSDEEATQEITLNDKDYAVTGDSKYKNFYLKGKTEEEIKSIELEKLSKILKTNYKVKVGTVYAITYKYYDGKGGKKTVKLKAVLEE